MREPPGLSEAAAAGDLSGWLRPDTPLLNRVRALAMAADHQRLTVIDQLLDAGTPIDAEDLQYRRQALRLAVTRCRVDSVAHLLRRGADPYRRDPFERRTALQWCRHARDEVGDSHEAAPGYDRIEALLTAAGQHE